MKTITNILIILLLASVCSFSQKNYKKILEEKQPATNIKLTEDQQKKKIIQFILQFYGPSFKYYYELLKGNYKFESEAFSKMKKDASSKGKKDQQNFLTIY